VPVISGVQILPGTRSAAGMGLEFGDDFGGAFFGGAGDGAAGEAGAEGGAVADGGGELAFDGGDEVEDLRVGFDFPEFGDLDAAVGADLTEVVTERNSLFGPCGHRFTVGPGMEGVQSVNHP